MKVILNQNIDGLGNIGEIVSVKNGYARNYLIPKKLAILANETNQKLIAQAQERLEREKQKILKAAKNLAKSIEKMSVTISKQVGENEKIFGTVTTAEIADALANEGISVDKKDIKLVEEINKVGVYTAEVHLHPEVIAKLKVWVIRNN